MNKFDRPLRKDNNTCHDACSGKGKHSDLQMYGMSKLYNVLAVKEIQNRIGSPKGMLHVDAYQAVASCLGHLVPSRRLPSDAGGYRSHM